MGLLTKDQILGANDLPRKQVEVPEWGGAVYVRTMTGAERDAFESLSLESRSGGSTSLVNLRARLAVWTVVDESGNRLFSDSDIEALGKKSAKALSRIFNVIVEVNHFGEKDIEDLAGKDLPGPSADSGSA